ncbi:MAG: fimbria/pilus outer membrane usher protein [Pseudomonadota bacterium]|nr:fimbria/pilus outer membrane usher protein [Pseudomonadota bacterium]
MVQSTQLSSPSKRRLQQPFFAAFLALLALTFFGLGFARAEDTLPPPGHLTDTPQPAGPIAPPVAGDTLPAPGHLVDDGTHADAASQPAALQLEVMIDGYKINMVAGFNHLADGTLSSARSELTEIGIKAPGIGKADEQIALASIPGLTYKLDESALTIDLSATDAARIPKAYDVVPKQDMLAADGGYGMVLNYGAYAAANTNLGAGNTNFTGASLNLDARAYAPFGVLQQTAIVGTTTFSDLTTTRLDTSWTYSSQNRAETYHVGDFVSGALDWTRPVRMAGVEAQRNFSIRPDLITTPMANFSGSAAVPSTLDVFVNGMKTYSQQVQPGPFVIDRMPMISAQGDAQLVLTDTSGRQTAVNAPLYSSPLLLAPKLFDYSVDLGLARLNYGVDSFDYDTDPMLIASGRYGVTKSITAQAHLEAKSDLIEGGLGGVFQAGKIGTFNVAAALSDYQGNIGGFSYLAWDWENKSLRIHASSSRTFGNFNDLAAVTANQQVVPGTGIISAAVPHAVDQLTVSYGVPDLQLTLGGGVIHYLPANGPETLLINANASKSLRHGMTLFANAYIDSLDTSNFGFGVGVTMPLGGVDKSISASSGANYDNKNGTSVQASASKPLDGSYGSYGWRVNGLYNKGTNLSASGAYRAEQALVSADVNSNSNIVSGDMRAEGSLIGTKAGVFAGNQVQDAFAVVDAGVPGVRVEYENRYVGTTGKNGKLLLTQLQSYRPAKISIDPNTLPLNSNVTETDKRVAARTMSGVVVDFGVTKDTGSALVIIKDKAGAFVQPGTLVTVENQKDPFPMGYDGQVYLTGLKSKNAIMADMKGQPCKVSFNYKEDEATQVIIGPLTCE